MVIFHSYVKLAEGKSPNDLELGAMAAMGWRKITMGDSWLGGPTLSNTAQGTFPCGRWAKSSKAKRVPSRSNAPMIHSDLLHCCTWYCLLFWHKICALHRTRIFSGNMSCDVMFCDWRLLASPRKNGPFVPQPTHPVQRWSCCWLPQTEPLPESNDEIGKTKLRSINGGSTAQTKSRWN